MSHTITETRQHSPMWVYENNYATLMQLLPFLFAEDGLARVCGKHSNATIAVSILEQCRENNIEYAAFVNPLYKDQFELLIQSPAFPVYIQFLEFLAGQGGFWYFGGVNEITSDKNFFWDAQHPRKILGNLIAESMFSERSPEYKNKMFGSYYNSDNIRLLVEELNDQRAGMKYSE